MPLRYSTNWDGPERKNRKRLLNLKNPKKDERNAMPSLIIPEQYSSGLAALRNFPESGVPILTRALQEIPSTAQVAKDITASITPKLTGLEPQNISDLVRTLYSLYHVRALADAPLDEFVAQLADAMTGSGKAGLVLSDVDRAKFVRKMKTLLDVESLTFLAKANALQRDHEHIFHDAKILTDLRPVFHAPDQQPTDMIVEYTLKIVFHDGSRHRELYMVLDAGDLLRLRAAIDRAETKAASLKSLLESKGLTYLPLLSEVG